MAGACYVYAILPAGALLPVGLTGLDGEPLWTVPARDLAAVVSAPGDASPHPTLDRLLCHEAVVEVIGRAVPSLPVRFGMVLADAAAVARALDVRAGILAEDLRRVGGRVELGVTILAEDSDRATGEIGAHERDRDAGYIRSAPFATARGTESGEAVGAGNAYLRMRLAQHQQEATAHARAAAVAERFDRALGAQAIERRRHLCPAPHLLLRAQYLLDPSSLEGARRAFDEVRRTLREAQPDVRCLLSGPWPPYSFVSERPNGSQGSPGHPLSPIGRGWPESCRPLHHHDGSTTPTPADTTVVPGAANEEVAQ